MTLTPYDGIDWVSILPAGRPYAYMEPLVRRHARGRAGRASRAVWGIVIWHAGLWWTPAGTPVRVRWHWRARLAANRLQRQYEQEMFRPARHRYQPQHVAHELTWAQARSLA